VHISQVQLIDGQSFQIFVVNIIDDKIFLFIWNLFLRVNSTATNTDILSRIYYTDILLFFSTSKGKIIKINLFKHYVERGEGNYCKLFNFRFRFYITKKLNVKGNQDNVIFYSF
jgi:hypothetical protein